MLKFALYIAAIILISVAGALLYQWAHRPPKD